MTKDAVTSGSANHREASIGSANQNEASLEGTNQREASLEGTNQREASLEGTAVGSRGGGPPEPSLEEVFQAAVRQANDGGLIICIFLLNDLAYNCSRGSSLSTFMETRLRSLLKPLVLHCK